MIYFQGQSNLLDPGILESVQVFARDGTFVAPFTGYAVFLAIGGGGGGAMIDRNIAGGVNQFLIKASGGGAGGTCIKRVLVNQGQTFTITVGAGGASQASVENSQTNGNAGTASTVVGPNLSMSAGGGSGGTTTAGVGTCAGGAGGTASNGDVNYTGGAGGSILNVTNDTYSMATGGGAPNFFNATQRGGNIPAGALVPTGGTTNGLLATGGAGINGGGGALSDSTLALLQQATVGGGVAGGLNTLFPQLGLTLFGFNFEAIFQSTATLTNLLTAQLRYNGGDAGFVDGFAAAGGAGAFIGGGGGAVSRGQNTLGVTIGGAGGIGSGGGGACGQANTSPRQIFTSAGGNGLVLVRLTKST